jgi:hypothetical protein
MSSAIGQKLQEDVQHQEQQEDHLVKNTQRTDSIFPEESSKGRSTGGAKDDRNYEAATKSRKEGQDTLEKELKEGENSEDTQKGRKLTLN